MDATRDKVFGSDGSVELIDAARGNVFGSDNSELMNATRD